MKIDEKFG